MADIVGTQGNDVLQGGAQDDLLQGLGGNDTLDGGGGTNRLEGGTGNDTFFVHSGSDTAVENPGEGTDIVLWSGAGTYLLPDNIEDLTLEAGATQATGNALDNTITANIDVDSGVSVTLDGGAGADSVWGGANDDTIFGGTGDDFLDGAGGGDEIHGGAGNDHIRGESFSFGAGWNDTLFGDAGDDLLFGLDGDDELTGGDGNDILDGYAGDDTMNGGVGADWFQVDVGTNGLDRDVVQDFSDGEDKILLALDGLTAPDMSSVTSIVQNGADTVVSFTSGAEMRLLGVSAGSITSADFFFYQDGSAAAETLSGGSFQDVLWGEGGNDKLVGGTAGDVLDGGDGADRLQSGTGKDSLEGGAGDDRLAGGGGRDTLVFVTGSDSDTVVAFQDSGGAQDDLIDVSGLGITSMNQIGKVAQGDDLVLTFGSGDEAVLVNYLATHAAADLQANDLIFA